MLFVSTSGFELPMWCLLCLPPWKHYLPRRNDEWNPVSVEKKSSGAKLASDMLFQFDVSKNG